MLRQLFAYDPEKRLTAREALEHKWFQEEPRPTNKYVLRVPAKHNYRTYAPDSSDSAFLTISGTQLPPQRRITHDEASASMLSTANAANANAPPPLPQAATIRPNSTSFAGSVGTAYNPTGYGVGMSRLGGGAGTANAGSDGSGGGNGGGNVRKKARLK